YTNVPALAKAFSLDASRIQQTGLPSETIYNGIPVLIVPLETRADVENVQADSGALKEVSREAGAKTVLVFSRETLLPTSTVHCRVFAPGEGVPEDAATGSANGPLGFYLVRHKLIKPAATTRIVSEQGFEMKRPSLLYIDVDVNLETGDVAAVRVG